MFCSSRVVRTVLVFLLGSLVFATAAVAEPLSTKEIALMLRSGYSSESVLKEIASRHVADSLDPATKKSMVDFGASPQLINTLETNAYAVSAAEGDKAKQHEAEIAARRAAQIAEYRRLNSLYQSQQAQARART